MGFRKVGTPSIAPATPATLENEETTRLREELEKQRTASTQTDPSETAGIILPWPFSNTQK